MNKKYLIRLKNDISKHNDVYFCKQDMSFSGEKLRTFYLSNYLNFNYYRNNEVLFDSEEEFLNLLSSTRRFEDSKYELIDAENILSIKLMKEIIE